MRTETTTRTLYQFSELSEDAKEKAIKNLWDINVDFEWWEFTYSDAAEIGLKIQGFDIDRGSYLKGSFTKACTEVADLILSNHGEGCDTFKLATEFLKDRAALVAKYSDGVKTSIVSEENVYDFDQECDELEEEFDRALKEEYLCILRKEYEYQTSEEAIIETIEANGYEFTEEGELA
jgi:hypothetical protein